MIPANITKDLSFFLDSNGDEVEFSIAECYGASFSIADTSISISFDHDDHDDHEDRDDHDMV